MVKGRIMNYKTPHGLLTGLAAMLVTASASADIRFQDVSSQAGVTGFTESWGSSWGDLNGDNWPDLFVQGHNGFQRVYRNTGDASIFENIAYELDPGGLWFAQQEDKHGASWADFDNDGDMDILQGVSATGPAQLLVNNNSKFTESAVDADLSSDGAARQPVWFDYTGDGFLDVAQLAFSSYSLRRQDFAQFLDFDDDATGAGFSCQAQLNYGQMIDLNNDGKLEFICAKEGNFPFKVYDVSKRPFVNVTSLIPVGSQVTDTAIGDFNRDLRNDFIMTRGSLRGSGATQINSQRIEGWIRKGPGSQQPGFSFAAQGQVTFTIDHKHFSQTEASHVYVLNTAGPTSLTDEFVQASYDAGTQRWSVRLVTSTEYQAYVDVDTVQPATGLTEDNLDGTEDPKPTFYLESLVGPPPNNTTTWSYRQSSVGLQANVSCVSAVAGDFDNDMDMDFFLVCRDGVNNLPDRLYENLGNGTFALVQNSGAEGVVGAGHTIGVGESVTMADYDVDGWLDLFVMNGLLFFPIGRGGPEVLLHNTTSVNGGGASTNRWLEIDLVGAKRKTLASTGSNRDGVGAKVYVTAGGVTQLREQNGGYHRWSQDSQRLHFGLGGNQTADTVEIRWPSGRVDTFTNVASNTLYKANEGTVSVPPSLVAATLGPPVHTTLQPGDECGEPPYNFNVKYGPVMHIWRDCPGNTWHFRAKGGRVTDMQRISQGTIAADAPFSNVSGTGLAAGDFVNTNGNTLNFKVGAWFSNNKGFNFDTSGQSSACLNFSTQDIDALIVGASKKRLLTPLNLVTLGACN